MSDPIEYAPGQDDRDIPERGWDVEPWTGVLREEVKDVVGLPEDLITELEIGLGLVEGSRQYDTAIGAAEITMNYYGKQSRDGRNHNTR